MCIIKHLASEFAPLFNNLVSTVLGDWQVWITSLNFHDNHWGRYYYYLYFAGNRWHTGHVHYKVSVVQFAFLKDGKFTTFFVLVFYNGHVNISVKTKKKRIDV